MIFQSVNGTERPVRLCERTRRFAAESLGHKYGLHTEKVMSVGIGSDVLSGLSDIEKYDLAIKTVAEKAPIRICEGEKVSGAATLGLGIRHLVPATCGDKPLFPSISHLTVDFGSVLKLGTDGIRAKAEEAYKKYRNTEKEPFAKSCLNCLDAFETYRQRYLEALKDKPGYEENYGNLLNVPKKPAGNYYEAVQSIWFTFSFLRLCGNWPGIGRLDLLLKPYLEKDLSEGRITLDEAREILAHFFIKGCEWIRGGDCGSGDAQHYQNIVISGVDESGEDITNEVTYLILDIIEETGISDFPTTVRVNKNTSEKLLRRVAEVIRFGGGVVAVYNEDLVLRSLTSYGYEEKEARNFANDGCWEVQIPGKTYFTYHPFDSLQILQKTTLQSYTRSFDSFEELYARYIKDLGDYLNGFLSDMCACFDGKDEDGNWIRKPAFPCTVIALFEQGCIEKGLSYLELGPVYNVISPHIGGLSDTVNFLYAVKKLVFDDKKVGFDELMKILADNWEGYETLRLYAQNKYAYYGNDNDEADGICARLLSDFADICAGLDGRCGYNFPGGVSTFGRQLEWSPNRLACAHGRRAHEVLAANASPTPGTDKEGATAIIRSYCKNDLAKLPTGAALDIKLLPSSVKGEDGIGAIVSLIRGFVALGGFFMQPDVVDVSVLREAQVRPENYQNLSVRVSGWNARFVTLNKEWQDMVIGQNEFGCGC